MLTASSLFFLFLLLHSSPSTAADKPLAPPNISPDSVVISPLLIACRSAYMGLSNRGKVSPGPLDALSPLPEIAKSLAATLPTEDQEVLYHLLRCNFIVPKGREGTGMRNVRAAWSRNKSGHRKVSDETISQSSANRQRNVGGDLSEIARILKEAGKYERKLAHKPTLGCSCFQCYLSFWSRWNASPNMRAISDILDIVDQHALEDPSWQVPLTGLGSVGHRRKNRVCEGVTSVKEGEEAEASNKGGGEGSSTQAGAEKSFSGIGDNSHETEVDVGGSVGVDMPCLEEVEDEMQDVVTGEGGRMEEPNRSRQMRGRGFFGRIFPDALGGLAERLWGLLSLRSKSRSVYSD